MHCLRHLVIGDFTVVVLLMIITYLPHLPSKAIKRTPFTLPSKKQTMYYSPSDFDYLRIDQ